MASLRARLVAGVLALAAVGLLTLGLVTYLEQRSFLLDRVDQQVRAAPAPVTRALDDDRGPGRVPGHFDGDDAGGVSPHDGAFDGGPPAGTYAERRDRAGRVVAARVLDYGRAVSARPKLPAQLPVGRLLTVSGRSGGDPRYRVLATADPFHPGSVLVIAVPMREADQTLSRLLLVEALVVAAVLLLLGLVAAFVVRVGLLPLDRIGHTAGAIAGGDLSHRVDATDPRTEVGRLGIALNAMLDRLERAFAERRASEDRLRRFIADASHELRTPLASIRGYAELFRIGAAREPAETEKAMRRIEEEAARMGVLVEDLLTLARLDEVRDVEPEPVDAGALVRDAADDARATAPEREISADVAGGDVVVLGDRDRLRQVLANLVRNALVHTPAGTPVELAAARERAEVVLTVRDHGPGLPAGTEPDVLFERFWRAEGGRKRGRGGAGLGLAIVAGIVDAHHGRVEAGGAPGGGAVFRVRLPAARGAVPAGREPPRGGSVREDAAPAAVAARGRHDGLPHRG